MRALDDRVDVHAARGMLRPLVMPRAGQRAPGSARLDVDRASIRRGAANVVRQFSRVADSEQVALLSWRANALSDVMSEAVGEAGGVPSSIAVDDLEHTSEARVAHLLDERLRGCTASMLLAEHGIPPAISMAILGSVERLGLRHLHLTRLEPRLFMESFGADPERIARINRRVVSSLEGARRLEVRSAAGTDLVVHLDPHFPLLQSDGRPDPGRAENLPAGSVQLHPAGVEGVFVADRGAIGAVRPDLTTLRSHPLRVTFERARAVRVESASDELASMAEGYLLMHEHAARVGIVALPTNYLIQSETGIEIQDALLPGVNVILGYSNPTQTRALHRCPVQLRLFGRDLDVKAGDAVLVRGGRLSDELVER